jgi:hypothetical protein
MRRLLVIQVQQPVATFQGLVKIISHFAAQFMKRDRSDNPANEIFYSGQNNTSAVGGYDAYLGT